MLLQQAPLFLLLLGAALPSLLLVSGDLLTGGEWGVEGGVGGVRRPVFKPQCDSASLLSSSGDCKNGPGQASWPDELGQAKKMYRGGFKDGLFHGHGRRDHFPLASLCVSPRSYIHRNSPPAQSPKPGSSLMRANGKRDDTTVEALRSRRAFCGGKLSRRASMKKVAS